MSIGFSATYNSLNLSNFSSCFGITLKREKREERVRKRVRKREERRKKREKELQEMRLFEKKQTKRGLSEREEKPDLIPPQIKDNKRGKKTKIRW